MTAQRVHSFAAFQELRLFRSRVRLPLVCFISLQASPRWSAARRALRVLAPLALSLCLASRAFAQSPVDGTLRGRVFASPQVSPVGASVYLRRDDNSWQQTIHAARNGSFTVLALVPGDYTLQSGPCSPQHFSISPGAITEAEIDLSSCSSGQPLLPRSTSLPLPTLDLSELSELDSAANDATLAAAPADETIGDEPSTPEAARETSELGLAGPSVNGLSPTANSTLLDGLSTTQNFHSSPRGSGGSPRTSATFGESATRSFQLQPRSFSAQNDSAGGLIAITSRGQATRLHGTAFALTRQSVFAATNPFSVVTRYNNGAITSQLLKPSDSLVQAGAAAGFPLSPLPYPGCNTHRCSSRLKAKSVPARSSPHLQPPASIRSHPSSLRFLPIAESRPLPPTVPSTSSTASPARSRAMPHAFSALLDWTSSPP